jgi:adenylyl-sulfate kinase
MSTERPRHPYEGHGAALGPGASEGDGAFWEQASCARDVRRRVTGMRGGTVWFTGLPAAGKSTLARSVERELLAAGVPAYVLDGDNVRHGLSVDLGFSPQDRGENVRRIAHVAVILSDAGVIALVSLISPYATMRDAARRLHEQTGLGFVEVWIDTPLDLCERRDPKGLYARARRGELGGMTGIDAPYEVPLAPDLRVRPQSVRASTKLVLDTMRERGLVGASLETGELVVGPASGQPTGLTLREREILSFIALGLTNKEIARRLAIRPATVKNHVHHILTKLRADRRGQAVARVRGRAV